MKPQSIQLSVIIPLYNEQENILPLYERLTKTLAPYSSYEILFVDDGSTDQTAQNMARLEKQDSRVTPIYLKRNFGQTAAMMAGIDHSRGEILVSLDGDLQNPPEEIPKLLEKLEEGYDVCSGWRVNRSDKWLTRKLPSKAANKLISIVSGVPLNDYGCTLKAYRRDVMEDTRLYGEMHRFIPIYASWSGAKIVEIPVKHSPRTHGQSKYGIGRTFKVILDLMVIKFLSSYASKPIYVFGGFGLLNFIASFAIFGLMLYYKLAEDLSFIQTPLPLLAVFFLLMGCFSILLGLLAELLTRTYHESQGKPAYLIRKKTISHDT